jgi:C4-dicarboxylate transporter DctM subunit
MILYAVLTETSIAALFAAGLLPGIMLALMLAGTAIIVALRDPSAAPPVVQRPDRRETMPALLGLLPVLALIVVVIGSIYGGYATPTEAAAVGAAGALLLAGARRRLGFRTLAASFDGTVRTTAMFLLLLTSGLLVTFLLSRLGVPQAVAEWLAALPLPPVVVMAMIVLVLVGLGFFLDPMSILVIMVPILFPTVTALGYDPVWFGVIVTITIEIAAITPPVGFNLFVLRSVVPEASMAETARGAAIFVVPMLLGIVLLFAFPQTALFLPSLIR